MTTSKIKIQNNTFKEVMIYQTPDKSVKVEIYLKDENLWLTQIRIAELFGVERSVVTKHLKNIFYERELDLKSNVQKMHIAKSDKPVKYYNLNVIIAVGYRINSIKATKFRIWATQVLKEYIIKGFAMDDERLKDPDQIFGKDYFEEQLARIRNIRSSERRMYQKITDIYAECSADYDPNSDMTKDFFATVQNKLHFAITGQTAAEIIAKRIGNKKLNMGLTNWKNGPKGKIRETDVVIAKNYLNEIELDKLNRIVTVYLDYADMMAKDRIVIYMEDWIKKLDAFLKFSEKDILSDNGKVSHEVAEQLALGEYKKFRIKQDKNYISDFDREVKKLLKK